ncbi:MAG: hypothetical protein J7M27_06855 [Candidatus Latescibacteria bacterium]|nr:hypothetical protein [Candidatus Latescibacterota bacterium]
MNGVRDCKGGVCVGVDAVVNNAGIDNAIKSIQKIFAKSMLGGGWGWNNTIGAYVKDLTAEWDITDDLEGTKTKPPTVSDISISPDTGKGSVASVLKFYAWADDNHMPLKKITIDWGDGQSIVSGGDGSYYQNRKDECRKRCDAPDEDWDGLACYNDGGSNCMLTPPSSSGRPIFAPGTCRLQFGDSDDACEDKPFEFSHVYGCSAGRLESLDACEFEVGGNNIVNSPCKYYGNCYFRPKVQVLDNWGWCNGTCKNSYHPGHVGEEWIDKGCYDGMGEFECYRKTLGEDNPYTYYSGNIIVTP